jgi:uncharacterized ferredoxin-like protein
MALVFEEQSRKIAVSDVARTMLIAARTAPKAGGIDNLVMAIADKEDIVLISQKMKEMVEKNLAGQTFLRDAENILAAESLVLIGTKIKSFGIPMCGLCGHADCAEKNKYPNSPCAFNTGDLGIAVGSALATAADYRVDTRVMYSAGKAVRAMNMLGEETRIIYAVPLSCTGKNPFFDRKWPK